jgi:hypothetical protein
MSDTVMGTLISASITALGVIFAALMNHRKKA